VWNLHILFVQNAKESFIRIDLKNKNILCVAFIHAINYP
jgi:hypothetical protein